MIPATKLTGIRLFETVKHLPKGNRQQNRQHKEMLIETRHAARLYQIAEVTTAHFS